MIRRSFAFRVYMAAIRLFSLSSAADAQQPLSRKRIAVLLVIFSHQLLVLVSCVLTISSNHVHAAEQTALARIGVLMPEPDSGRAYASWVMWRGKTL